MKQTNSNLTKDLELQKQHASKNLEDLQLSHQSNLKDLELKHSKELESQRYTQGLQTEELTKKILSRDQLLAEQKDRNVILEQESEQMKTQIALLQKSVDRGESMLKDLQGTNDQVGAQSSAKDSEISNLTA